MQMDFYLILQIDVCSCGAALTSAGARDCRSLKAKKTHKKMGFLFVCIRNICSFVWWGTTQRINLKIRGQSALWGTRLVMKLFWEWFFPYINAGSGEGEGRAGSLKRMQCLLFCLDNLENTVFQMLIQISLLVNCSFLWFTIFVIWLINNWWSSSRKSTKIT